jgi:hypothetical protein
MKKLMFLLATLSLGTLCWADSAREDATDRLDNATQALHEIMGMPDKGIPEEVLEHAKCVAVVPHMVKAKALPPATPRMAGVRPRSSPFQAETGDCRSASKLWTWS